MNETLADISVHADSVLKILLTLRIREYTATEKITPFIRKQAASLFNHLLDNSQVPSECKRGTINHSDL